jgi:hypothetical protein
MVDVIYRVTYDDGSMCHTGYRPMAEVWAKRQGAKLEEIELKNPTRLRIVNSGDSMADCYERAFTGANRRPAMWAAFQAGWKACERQREREAVGRQILSDEQIDGALDMANKALKAHESSIRGQQCQPADDWHWHYARAIERMVLERINHPAGIPEVLRECCAEGCEWTGYTDRMLGAVGPLCPQCGEVTEPSDGASLVGLREGGGVVTGSGDVDKRVPVPASGTQEVVPVLINLGIDGTEHDRQAAMPTSPHGPDASAASGDSPVAYGIRQVDADEDVEAWHDIWTSPDVAQEEAAALTEAGMGERFEVIALYARPPLFPAQSGGCATRLRTPKPGRGEITQKGRIA